MKSSFFFVDYSTPLHYGAANDFFNIVKLLLDYNATLGIEDENGNNAHDIAIIYGSDVVANYLENV